MNIRRYRHIERERTRALAKRVKRVSVGRTRSAARLHDSNSGTWDGWHGWPLWNGGGGQPTPSPTLAKLKALAAAAPTSVSEFQTAVGIAPALGEANEPPPIFNELEEHNYQRYWVSGNGKNNFGGGTDNPRLTEVASCFNAANWGYMYGAPGITINFSDGSQADARAAYDGFGSSRPYIGIRTNARYLSVAGQHGTMFRLQVDDVFWPYSQIIGNNRYLNWDFGTAEFRNIVISGQADVCYFSDICVETGATVEPYDFMAERGNATMCAVGDSYQGYNSDYISFMEMTAFLIGCEGITETGRGSTGYQRNAGNVGWAAVEAERLAFVAAQLADLILVQMGINDDIPRDSINPGGTNPDMDTVDAILQTLTAYRTANPTALMVVQGPWAPNQVFAQQEGSKYRVIMDRIEEVMPMVGGDYIILNNIFGTWKTSWGTERPTPRGAYQTGTGNEGNPQGDGNGDTWVNPDGTHPTVPVGITGLSEVVGSEIRMALATA